MSREVGTGSGRREQSRRQRVVVVETVTVAEAVPVVYNRLLSVRKWEKEREER